MIDDKFFIKGEIMKKNIKLILFSLIVILTSFMTYSNPAQAQVKFWLGVGNNPPPPPPHYHHYYTQPVYYRPTPQYYAPVEQPKVIYVYPQESYYGYGHHKYKYYKKHHHQNVYYPW